MKDTDIEYTQGCDWKCTTGYTKNTIYHNGNAIDFCQKDDCHKQKKILSELDMDNIENATRILNCSPSTCPPSPGSILNKGATSCDDISCKTCYDLNTNTNTCVSTVSCGVGKELDEINNNCVSCPRPSKDPYEYYFTSGCDWECDGNYEKYCVDES